MEFEGSGGVVLRGEAYGDPSDPPVVLLTMSSFYALSGPAMAGWRFFARRRQRQLID